MNAGGMAGLSSPVLVFGSLSLFALSPLMRGGNRALALLVLEVLACLVLAAFALAWRRRGAESIFTIPVVILALSPLVIGVVQLLPVTTALWARLPGHDLYASAAAQAGAPLEGWRPLSLVPDRTIQSLLAATPIVAAFLGGLSLAPRALRWIAGTVVAVAACEVLFALAQVSGGEKSALLFGLSSSRPVGTFANANHLANYLCMALVLLGWLAYERHRRDRARGERGPFATSAATAPWAGAVLLMVVGVLLTQSRGAALFALPMAAIAWVVVARIVLRDSHLSRFVWPMIIVILGAALAALGLDYSTGRVSASELTGSASARAQLAYLTIQSGAAFFPWGSGWGTFEAVFPRFQPVEVQQVVNHAHMDYAELFFEGGALFLAVVALVVWMAAGRLRSLVTSVRGSAHPLAADVGSMLAGLGLAGFLLHSLVEFNMRIPANAMLAAFLAGMFLRLPPRERGSHGDTVPVSMD